MLEQGQQAVYKGIVYIILGFMADGKVCISTGCDDVKYVSRNELERIDDGL